MALPFLADKKSMADVIAADRRPDGLKDEGAESDESSENEDLLAIAHELINAVHSKDASGVAAALRAAQDLCDLDE